MDAKIEKQLNRYLEGELSDEKAGDLLAWATECDENAAVFAKACAIDQMTGELFEEGRVVSARATAPSRFHFGPATWAGAAAIALSGVGVLVITT